MPARFKIGLIVEGDGELKAAPKLLSKALLHIERYDVSPGRTQNTGGRAKLLRSERRSAKDRRFEDYIERAYREPNEDAVLVLLDADNDCPVTLAKQLASRVIAYGARRPTAIVVAHRMYEAWFLACGPALVGCALPGCPAFDETFVVPNSSDKTTRGPKAHIEKHLPRDRGYKETQDPEILTSWLDIEMARQNSRSFQRFLSAVQQLLSAIDDGTSDVTPRI